MRRCVGSVSLSAAAEGDGPSDPGERGVPSQLEGTLPQAHDTGPNASIEHDRVFDGVQEQQRRRVVRIYGAVENAQDFGELPLVSNEAQSPADDLAREDANLACWLRSSMIPRKGTACWRTVSAATGSVMCTLGSCPFPSSPSSLRWAVRAALFFCGVWTVRLYLESRRRIGASADHCGSRRSGASARRRRGSSTIVRVRGR